MNLHLLGAQRVSLLALFPP
ncbi:hypothetical protein D021_0813A, partial [Vibrio parahaemolyticus 10296]